MTVIIMTKDEEKNIAGCICAIKNLVKRIVVVDSGSEDNTCNIARELGADIYHHTWVNYATQFHWAIENTDIDTTWIFRLDADEKISPEAASEIETICRGNETGDINGIIVRFKVTFLGKELKHGGIYPFKKLLIYKKGKGYMESRNMDEHIVLTEGRAVCLENDSDHYDFKDLTRYIDKHNEYATREMLDYFDGASAGGISSGMEKAARRKRNLKYKVYYKLPMGLRAHMYYLWRYYVLLGFLDGREGKIFAFLQAYWYRFLVDAKIYEQSRK